MTNSEFIGELERLLDAQAEGKEEESLHSLQWLNTALHPSEYDFASHCEKYGLLQEDFEPGYWNRLADRKSLSGDYVLRMEAGLISSSPSKPFSLQYRYRIETTEGKTLSICSDFLEAVESLKALLQCSEQSLHS